LTGDGAWVDGAAGASADAEDDEDKEGFKDDVDAAEVEKAVIAFRASAETWCKDEKIVA